ncbi:MAG: hypothetical protein AAFY34_01800 [Pseudomonadota bacterium]
MTGICHLPDPRSPDDLIEWRLTDTGVEWRNGSFAARWMPFACMRLVCIGHIPSYGGWRMRISGPPGAIIIASGTPGTPETEDAARAFTDLAREIVASAATAGVGTTLRWNDRALWPPFLWARVGGSVRAADEILDLLPPSVT